MTVPVILIIGGKTILALPFKKNFRKQVCYLSKIPANLKVAKGRAIAKRENDLRKREKPATTYHVPGSRQR
jgi:hypothetical protein